MAGRSFHVLKKGKEQILVSIMAFTQVCEGIRICYTKICCFDLRIVLSWRNEFLRPLSYIKAQPPKIIYQSPTLEHHLLEDQQTNKKPAHHPDNVTNYHFSHHSPIGPFIDLSKKSFAFPLNLFPLLPFPYEVK